jgi:hypothetical protein
MIWGSLLCFFVLDYFYNYVIGGPYVGALTQAIQEATFWFTTVLTVIVLMVPVLASRYYFVDVFPGLSDKVGSKWVMEELRCCLTYFFFRFGASRGKLGANDRSRVCCEHRPLAEHAVRYGLVTRLRIRYVHFSVK